MNDAQPSGANGGLKVGSLSPDELDKIAAVFVPTWDLPADAAALGATTAGAIPPPPDDVMTGAAHPAPSAKNDPKRTQMGIAAPMQPPPEAAFVPPKRADVDPMAPTGPLDISAAPAQPAISRPRPVQTPSLADQSSENPALAPKRSPLVYVIGGGVVVAAIAIFFALRGGDKPPPAKDTTAPTVESKALDLPDPNSVSTSAAATTTATSTAAAIATETATAAPTATETATAADTATAAKTAEPEPPKPTATAKPTATTPPAPPKMTATAAPKPPPATATPKPPPTKKTPQKIKDEF